MPWCRARMILGVAGVRTAKPRPTSVRVPADEPIRRIPYPAAHTSPSNRPWTHIHAARAVKVRCDGPLLHCPRQTLSHTGH